MHHPPCVPHYQQYMKSQPLRLGIYKVICLAVKHRGHSLAAQTTILQSLQYHEHLSEPIAECLTVLVKEFDHSQLGDKILREIAGKSFSAQDAKRPRAFTKLLVRFAELAPRAVLKQACRMPTSTPSHTLCASPSSKCSALSSATWRLLQTSLNVPPHPVKSALTHSTISSLDVRSTFPPTSVPKPSPSCPNSATDLRNSGWR
jgi:non-SMC mitotic condensation complex subunit 1, N-term